MKAGQLLSMVDASFIGSGELSPYQKALTRLQADAPPMDPALAKEVLHADLGRPAEEVFAEFTDRPMAAASIGQVHHAVLHDGRQVAVKIQYPGAAQAIRDDLANTELLATFFRLAASASGTSTQPDLRPTTREIAAPIAEEIDHRHEAANITAFSKLYRDHPFIRVPEVIYGSPDVDVGRRACGMGAGRVSGGRTDGDLGSKALTPIDPGAVRARINPTQCPPRTAWRARRCVRCV